MFPAEMSESPEVTTPVPSDMADSKFVADFSWLYLVAATRDKSSVASAPARGDVTRG